MKKFAYCFFLLLVGCVFAEEVVVTQPTQPLFLVANLDTILKGVCTLLGLLLSFVTLYLSYKRIQNETLNKALEALQAGVAFADDTYVEWAKRAKADGKLTKEERAEALQIAKAKALEIAKGPALDFLKEKGSDLLNAWIKKIVEKNKNAPVNPPVAP